MTVMSIKVSTSIIACTNAWYYFPRPARQSDVMQQVNLVQICFSKLG